MQPNWKPELKEEYFFIRDQEVRRAIWRDSEADNANYMSGVLYDDRFDATMALDGILNVFDTPVEDDDLGAYKNNLKDDTTIEAEFEVVENE